MSASAPQYSRTRKSARYLLDCRAVLYPESDPSERLPVNTAEISEGGLSIISPTELELNSKATLELVFPITGEFLRASIYIRNQNGFRYGLEFASVEPALAKMIRRFGHQSGVVG